LMSIFRTLRQRGHDEIVPPIVESLAAD
jgi:hypothetical protein